MMIGNRSRTEIVWKQNLCLYTSIGVQLDIMILRNNLVFYLPYKVPNVEKVLFSVKKSVKLISKADFIEFKQIK